MTTCTRRLQFCTGHRVVGHEGHCAHLHGHNYVVRVTASTDRLDPVGRVIDFSVLKDRIGGWIAREWDHGMVLWSQDTDGIRAITSTTPHRLFYLPTNPTAENMAEYLLHVVAPMVLVDTGVMVTHIQLWETENCYADATL